MQAKTPSVPAVASSHSDKARPQPSVLVTLATYNEVGNLEELVSEIFKVVPFVHILVIDDNSPDGTGQLADKLGAADPRVRVLHRPGKLGLGTALLAAIRYAIDHNYEYLLNMDADFSHHPRYLPGLLAGMAKYDVSIGSRYIAGGGTQNWPLSRRLISRSVNGLVRLLLSMPVKDASGAFRCYRVEKLRQARLDLIKSQGYSFQQEVLYRCRQAGCRLGEYPIVFENRQAGVSKVNWWEATRSLSMLFWLGLQAFFGVKPSPKPQVSINRDR